MTESECYKRDKRKAPLEPGERVRLVSLTGPVMIIESITEDKATCIWGDDAGNKKSEVWPTLALFRYWFFHQRLGNSWAWWEKNGPGISDFRLYSRGTSDSPPTPPITFNFGPDGTYFHEPPADPLASLSEMRKAVSN